MVVYELFNKQTLRSIIIPTRKKLEVEINWIAFSFCCASHKRQPPAFYPHPVRDANSTSECICHFFFVVAPFLRAV